MAQVIRLEVAKSVFTIVYSMAQSCNLVLQTLFATLLLWPGVMGNDSSPLSDPSVPRRTFSISIAAIEEQPSTTLEGSTTQAPAWHVKINRPAEAQGTESAMPDATAQIPTTTQIN